MITKIPAPAYEATATPSGLSGDLKAKALEAAQALDDGFHWVESAEGFEFWDCVHNRLKAIANGESLR